MKKAVFLLGVFISACYISETSAQLSVGGEPLSFSREKQIELQDIVFRVMPEVDVKALRAEDVYNDQIKDQPWRFGKDLFVDLNPGNSGRWTELENGDRLWQLGIRSQGALSINICFNNYRLPEGAKLFIYSADRKEVLGAFTSKNNQDDRYFATGLIMSDAIVIEYYEPRDAAFPGELNLWRVTHGYRSIGEFEKAFGSSGACNVNAVCPQGDPIRNQIRSVAMTILGGGLCSGALINNTNADGTPLFLTANHCYDDPGTVVFRFNWESSTCSNPATSPDYVTLSGAVDRAVYATSDVWLMELNDSPPEEYNVYYSGWNRESISALNEKVWCVHHPSGDIKKISWANEGVTTSDYLGATGSGTDHWRVGSWSDGTTTEGGSSGSPLFDADLRIIGQLHGGYAACGNTMSDWYGKLSVSWDGGGGPASRVKDWLDPINSGALVLDGYDPNSPQLDTDAQMELILSPVSAYSGLDTIQPAVVIRNRGNNPFTEAVVFCTLNGVDSTGISWTGSLETNERDTIFFPDIPLTPGLYDFLAAIALPGDENSSNDSLSLSFIVYDCQSLALPVFEGFDSSQLSVCWDEMLISGTNPEISFVESGSNPSCSPTQGPRMLEFNSYHASSGSSIRLESPMLSTYGMDSISLSFDWYHDPSFSSTTDRVVVQYSFDKSEWVDVQEFIRYNASYSGWERKTVEFGDTLDHRSEIYFGLQFISDYGSNCHLDSLVIAATSIAEPYPDFTVSDREIIVNDTVFFTDNSINGPFTTYEWDFGSGAVPETATGMGPHMVIYDTAGFKTVSLTLDGTYTRTKTDYILVEDNRFFGPFNLIAILDVNDVTLHWNWGSFNDGFEMGDFRLWDEMIEGPGTIGETGFAYWYILEDPDNAHTGDKFAKVDWGYDLDTWLITPEMEMSSKSALAFAWQGSYYWHVDPYDNGDLFVKISSDGGDTWEDIWTFGDIGEWLNWTWYETTIDLSAYAGSTCMIAFNLVANDNSEVLLDEVAVEDVEPGKLFGTIQTGSGRKVPSDSKSAGSNSKVAVTPMKSAEFADFSVFRNDAEIDKALEKTYYDENLEPGVYNYYIQGNYINPEYTTEASNVVTIEVPVSLTGNDEDIIRLIYPNPSAGLYSLVVSRPFELTITNINGELIREMRIDQNTSLIDISDQPAGLYLFHLRSEDNYFVLKAVVD